MSGKKAAKVAQKPASKKPKLPKAPKAQKQPKKVRMCGGAPGPRHTLPGAMSLQTLTAGRIAAPFAATSVQWLMDALPTERVTLISQL